MHRKWTTKERKIKSLQKMKKNIVLYLVLLGINGLISIFIGLDIMDLSALSWDSLKVGQKIGISLYLSMLFVGILIYIMCDYKISKLTTEIIEAKMTE
jgi:hypothetical protein